jgi:hypothetical protein
MGGDGDSSARVREMGANGGASTGECATQAAGSVPGDMDEEVNTNYIQGDLA